MGDFFVDDDDDEAEAQPIPPQNEDSSPEPIPQTEEQISEDVPKDIYGAGDVIKAYYHQYNSVYLSQKAARVGRFDYENAAGAVQEEIGPPDPDFNLTEALDREKIAEKDRPFFVDCKNYKQFQYALEYLEEDKQDREIINNTSALRGLAYGLVAGVTDPINFIPIGRALKFGTTAVKMAVEGAVVGAVNYGIRSKANNVFEVEDLALETAVSGMAAGVLTKALEAGIPIAKETYTELKNALKEAYRPNVTREFTKNAKGEIGLETTSIWGKIWEKCPDAMKKALNNCPKFMMANNEDPLMRQLSFKLFDEKVINPRGEGVINTSGLTAQMKLFSSKTLETSELIKKLELEHIKNGGTSKDFKEKVGEYIRDTGVVYTKDGPKIIENPDKGQYAKEVQTAGDAIIKFTSDTLSYAGKYKSIDIEAFNGGVKATRKVISDEFYENGGKVAPENQYITSLGHVFRKYDVDKIIEKAGDLRKYLRDEVHLNAPSLSPKKVEAKVDSIMATLTGNNIEPRKSVNEPLSGKPTALHERDIAITDKILYRLGIMDYDPITNFAESLRSIRLQAEFDRIGQEMGYKSWENLKSSYAREGKQKIGAMVKKNLPDDASVEQVKAKQEELANKRKYNLQMIEDVEAMFRGRFNADTSPRVKAAAGLVRAVTFLTTAGQLALSCPLDIAMLIMRHNFGHGLVSLFKDFSKGVVNGTLDVGANSLDIIHLNKAAEHIRNWKLKDKKEIEKCFGMLDSSFEKNRFAELGFEFNNDSELGKFGEKATEFVSKYTGINLITRSLKDSVAECEYSYLLKECLKENADMNYLAKMGISAEGKAKIKAAYEMRGYEKDGLSFLDLKNIGDEELSDQIHMSIQTLVDQTIMTPNIGDVPRWLRSAGGQFLCMFQTYPFLIYNNFLRHIPTGEISRSKATEVILASLALSAGYKYAKDTINGRDTDPTKAEFWKDVVDYSVLGNYIIDYATNVYNITHLKYGEDAVSKVSPTISAINRLAKAFSGSISAEGFMNMIPGLNFWYVRPFRNYAFKKIRGD